MRVCVVLHVGQLILRAWPGTDSEGCLPPQLHVQRLINPPSCPTRPYCLAKWELHFLNKVTGKQDGKRNCMTCLCPAQGKTLVLNLCAAKVVNDASEPKENTVLSSVVWTRSGRQMCLWETGTPRLNAYLFDIKISYFCCSVGEMSPSCGNVESPQIPLCPSGSERLSNTYLW